MTKTKTKQKILIITSIVVALIVMAAIFYFFYLNQKSNEEENPIKEVQVAESIKAEDLEEPDEQIETDGPREYISEYFKEGDFNAIGGKWEEVNSSEEEIEIFVRAKNKEGESDWYPFYKELIKSDNEINYYHAESPVLIRGDSYQYKIIFDNEAGEVRNLEITVINTMGTTSSRLFDKVTSLFSNNQARAASWNPANIISRNEWGGSAVNESATLWPPRYAKKSTKFVIHHTADTNKTCLTDPTQSKEDVKAIWHYHTYSNDWGDIGYNYLLDTCGRVFEGRLGGNNVIAGHASPYNFWDKVAGDGKIDETSIGVSVMGNYSNLKPDAKIFEGLGRIIGYKSYVNGIDPYGTSYFRNKTTYDIAGHRDYTSTACPGYELHSRLSSVRNAANTYKNQYLAEYGDYDSAAENIILWSARVSMQDVSNPDGFVLAKDPSIGEPITMLSSIKNNNPFQVNLKNVKVIGILDNGTEFTIGQTPDMSINANTVATIPAASYNISSFRYQTFKITYELHLVGPSGSLLVVEKEPTISTSYKYPSIVPHFPIVRTTSSIIVNPQSLKEGENLTLSASLKNLDPRPAYLYNFGPTVNVGNFSKNNYVIMPGNTTTYNEIKLAANPGSYNVKFEYKYGNGTTSGLIPSPTSLVTTKSLYISPNSINYNNVKLNSFRAKLVDGKLITTKTGLSPSIGEPVAFGVSLKNDNPYPVTLSNIELWGVRDVAEPWKIGGQSSLTLPGNSATSVLFDNNSYNITSLDGTTFKVEYTAEGVKREPVISPTWSYPSYLAHRPNIKLSSGPFTNPGNPIINSSTTLSFKLKNYDSRPAYFKNSYLKISKDGVDTSLKNVALASMLPGKEFTYSDIKTFTSPGEASLSAHFSYLNSNVATQAGGVDDIPVTTSTFVVSVPADYSKISLNSFRVTMEDTTTPLDNTDYVLADYPAVGEPVSVRPSLRNDNSTAVTISNIKINGTLSSGTKFLVGTIPSLTLTANSTTVVPVQTFTITSSYIHTFSISYEANGIIRSPYVKPTYSYQQILAHRPNVKLVKTPVFTPTTPIAYSPVATTYKLTNYDARPAYLRNITLLAKLNKKIPYYFPKVTQKINPSATYEYNKSIIPANGGTYYSNAEITYGNGSVAIPPSLSSTTSYANFKVYTEVATLNGFTIPYTSGKVGKEQHLNLKANETASQHYSASGTPLIDQNGMAGGWGAFGWRYGYPSVSEERYYVNMRWSYVDWYEAADGTCSTVDGRLDTCTRNYNADSMAWHWKKRVVVTNPANGKKVVASVIEAGPAIWVTRERGIVAGLSPEALTKLGAVHGTSLQYYWAADQTMSPGPIN